MYVPLTFFNYLLKHLKGTTKYASLLFEDFSSAHHMIQPFVLVNKILHLFNLDYSLMKWILHFQQLETARSKGEWCPTEETAAILYGC